MANPRLFREARLASHSVHHNVRTKARGLKAPLRIERLEPGERGGRHKMHSSAVEKCSGRKVKLRDGVFVVKAVDVRPILFGLRLLGVLNRLKRDLTVQGF